MVRDFSIIMMVVLTRGSLRMVNLMAMELKFIKVEIDMKANLKKIARVAKEFIIIKMGIKRKESGQTINKKVYRSYLKIMEKEKKNFIDEFIFVNKIVINIYKN